VTTQQENAQELIAMDLKAIREALRRTQAEAAEGTDMTQSEVSQLERRADHRLSTLRRYVEALGGELEVIAIFGDRRVRLHAID
jgi:transcriptional regulator with XRE-family HTH domain